MTRLTVVLSHLCNLALFVHFLCASHPGLAALTLAIALTLWSHRTWGVVLNQLLLLVGAATWLDAAGDVLAEHLDEGQRYRMLCIFGDLATLALVAAGLWLWPRVRDGWIRVPQIPPDMPSLGS